MSVSVIEGFFLYYIIYMLYYCVYIYLKSNVLDIDQSIIFDFLSYWSEVYLLCTVSSLSLSLLSFTCLFISKNVCA